MAEKGGDKPIPLDEILAQLTAITAAGEHTTEAVTQQGANSTAQTDRGTALAASTVTATLPNAGLAFLTEMIAQVRASHKADAMVSQTATTTTDNTGQMDPGLRLLGAQRGGQITLPESSPPLQANSPAFADELMGKVGRMRLFSRGSGGEQQVRVTLVPRDLGAVDLRLRIDGQNRVHLVLTTETDAARDLMNRQMSQLRDALERQNMGFGDVEVHVDARQRGNEEMAQWQFNEPQDQQEDGILNQENPTTAIEAPQSAISASDGGLSVIA